MAIPQEHICHQVDKLVTIQIDLAQSKMDLKQLEDKVSNLHGELKKILYAVLSVIGLSIGKLVLYYVHQYFPFVEQ